MLLTLPVALERIVRDLRDSGFHAVVVGGSVRDALLGLEPKDFDIEVYGISYDHLAAFLASRGRVDLVGKSFGVVKFTAPAKTLATSASPAATAKPAPATAIFTPTSTPPSPRAKPPPAATSPSTP